MSSLGLDAPQRQALGFVLAAGCERTVGRPNQYLAYGESGYYAHHMPDPARDIEVAKTLKQHLYTLVQAGDLFSDKADKLMQREVLRFTCCAGKFLKKQKERFSNELRQLSTCKANPHLMNLVLIDRLAAALKFRVKSKEEIEALTIARIRGVYKTGAAGDQLTKLIGIPTARALEEK